MKNVTNLGTHPLINDRMTRIRKSDATAEEFRQGVHDISQLMAYEVTRDFILRAGLGMLNGFLQILREARVGHIGLFRNEETLKPESYYCNLPHDLAESEVVLIDPMLATGNSSAEAARQLVEAGAKRLRFACLVSAPEGLAHFTQEHPDVPVYTAAIDRGLNEIGYIVPGLGDAGDRYFGT